MVRKNERKMRTENPRTYPLSLDLLRMAHSFSIHNQVMERLEGYAERAESPPSWSDSMAGLNKVSVRVSNGAARAQEKDGL